MKKPITINPARHGERVIECVRAFIRGNDSDAMVFAMMAGVNAGLLGLTVNQCPFKHPRMITHNHQWHWGRAQSIDVNKQHRKLI